MRAAINKNKEILLISNHKSVGDGFILTTVPTNCMLESKLLLNSNDPKRSQRSKTEVNVRKWRIQSYNIEQMCIS